MVLLAVAFIFCSWYIVSDYAHLSAWYRSLNNCFYHSTDWNNIYFTPQAKTTGNCFCLATAVISAIGIFLLGKRFVYNLKKKRQPYFFSIPLIDLILSMTCIAAGCIGWQYGSHRALPAYDEVFSAQFSAGIHPFQTISYYVLPNNHILFNVINGIIFHSAADKVITGRFLSLLIYIMFILSLYTSLKWFFKERLLVFLTTLTLAAQYFIWGFAFQARGYELYLLAEWGMALSLFAYLTGKGKNWLYLLSFCIAAGYFCIPSFLYSHVGIMVFTGLYQVIYQKRDTQVWKHHLTGLLLTLLLYTPALCFSGMTAFAGNNYVAPMGIYKTTYDFCSWMFPYFHPYIGHIFSDARLGNYDVGYLLFFSPLLLLFNPKNKLSFLAGLTWLCSWLSLFIIVIIMKRLPFERNLIGHYQLTVFAVCLIFYKLACLSRLKHSYARPLIYISLLLLLLARFVSTNIHFQTGPMKEVLYEYDVNAVYTNLDNKLKVIPPGDSISFSDFAFYARYICLKNHHPVGGCGHSASLLYIIHCTEQLPPDIKASYIKDTTANEYVIYKRN